MGGAADAEDEWKFHHLPENNSSGRAYAVFNESSGSADLSLDLRIPLQRNRGCGYLCKGYPCCRRSAGNHSERLADP